MSFARFLFFLAAALGLAGSLSAQSAAPATPAASALTTPEPLTLDAAIQLALAQNRTIKVQAFDPAIARANLLAAYGRFDPALTFRRSYAEDNAPTSINSYTSALVSTDAYSLTLDGILPWGLSYSLGASAANQRGTFNHFVDQYATFGGITVTQPLLRGFGPGANLLEVRVARADRGIADWTFRQTVIDTVTRVIYACSDLLLAQQQLRVTERSRELASGLVAENEKRFRVGSMSENDVVQARARTATRGDAIIFAQQQLRDAENTLRQLIGATSFPVDHPLELAALPSLPSFDVDPAADLQRALDLRPDYQSARLDLEKRRANRRYARNQVLPRVDFVGSYGYNGLDSDFAASRRMVRDRDNRSYSAGVVVSVPLTFAESRGRARAARLQLEQGEADLERLEQDIAVAVAHAASQIDSTRRRVDANRSAYDLAQQALDAELKKLRAGTSSTFFVLNLQEELASVELRLSAALADQRRAFAAYDREIGTTLTHFGILIDGDPRHPAIARPAAP